MRRREFIKVVGGVVAVWPLAAWAQQLDRMRRVGVLSYGAENDPEGRRSVAAFHQTLQQLGWVDGRNLRIEHRWAAGNLGQVGAFAKELVGLEPNVIVGHTTPTIIALQKETSTIPIVFVQISDPIGTGFIANLAHPGGNVTGFSSFESSMGGKWVEILKEIAPGVARIALMFNPETAPYVTHYYQGPFEAAASSFRVQPNINPVHNDLEVESAITALGREPGGGLIVMPDTFTSFHREQIIALAARHKLPVIYPWRFAVIEGGLMSYGVDQVDLFRRAAAYVDRILKGEKPGELPVQAPVKFELVINLKTAKALGLDVPLQLQQRADEVIE